MDSNQIHNWYDTEAVLEQEYADELYEILQNQSDINQKDDSYTILIHLAWTGRLDLVKLAVDAGADVNIITTNDNSFALYEAARNGRQEVYDYLAPLTSPELVEIATKALPEGIIYRQRKNNHAVEVFIHAALFGNIDAVSAAISQGIDVNTIGSNGEAALHKAIRNNQSSIVLILLEAGADINNSCNNGETVLMFAVAWLNTKIVQKLLELGANVNAKDENNYTALTVAKKLSKQVLNEPKLSEKLSEIIKLLENYGAIEN
mgnify:CR=1 FL=1